jgi:hypothetical protein
VFAFPILSVSIKVSFATTPAFAARLAVTKSTPFFVGGFDFDTPFDSANPASILLSPANSSSPSVAFVSLLPLLLPLLFDRRSSSWLAMAPRLLPRRLFQRHRNVRRTARAIMTPIGTPTEAPIATPNCFDVGLEGVVTEAVPEAAGVVVEVADACVTANAVGSDDSIDIEVRLSG